jgi:hypothetical protein
MTDFRLRPASLTWIGAGLALDGAALAVLWLIQGALGLGSNLGSAWPLATGFATIPWLTHTLLLPWLSGARAAVGHVLATTAAYIFGAAFLIPAGGALMAFLAISTGVFDSPVWSGFAGLDPGLRRRVADILGNLALIILIPGAVGAAIGAMGGLLRRGLGEAATPWSVDVFGGFAAAVIAFCGFGLAVMSGMDFARPEWLRVFAPVLGTAIGALAYLPHLMLTAPRTS